MTLADFTRPGLIVPRLRGRDAATVIQELAAAMQQEGRAPDGESLCRAALNRELLGGTDMEDGMAFPHARLAGLSELSFALGRCDGPLEWGAGTARQVRLVFLLAVPAMDITQYLRLISGLARLSKDGPLVKQLHAVQDAPSIIELLRKVELRSGSTPVPAKRAATQSPTGLLVEP